jgi:hypothetical protein
MGYDFWRMMMLLSRGKFSSPKYAEASRVIQENVDH